jgi:hypothetical protein
MANIANVKVLQGNVLSLSGSSVQITGSTTVSGNLTVQGTVFADALRVDVLTQNVVIQTSGSTIFGDNASDIHTFSGSVNITGGLAVTGTVSASVFSGSAAGLTGIIKSVTIGDNLTGSTVDGAVTVALTGSITGGLTSISALTNLSSSTVTASNLLVTGTASLAENNLAYVRYAGLPDDKVVIYPGLLVSGSAVVSGNLDVTGSVSASSFTGSGANLKDIPLSALTGAAEGKIILGSGTTFVTASLFSGSGITINSGTIAGVPFLAITGSATGVTEVSGGANIVIDNGQGPAVTASLSEDLTGLNSISSSFVDVVTLSAATASLTGQLRLAISGVVGPDSVTLDDSHNVIVADALAGAVTITIPNEPADGRVLVIKKSDDGPNTVTVSGTIDSQAFFELNGPYQSITLIALDNNWNVV